MRTLTVMIYVLFLAGLGSPSGMMADERTDQGAAANELVGTWKLVSGKYGGRESTLLKDATTLKHMNQ